RQRFQRALALHLVREVGQVGFQPVLLLGDVGRFGQRTDHHVDVVLERFHLASGFDFDRAGEITLGYRVHHLTDRTHLTGQVTGELVHVVGQVAPGSFRTRYVGFTAQFSFHTYFARHVGDLLGKGGERHYHRV